MLRSQPLYPLSYAGQFLAPAIWLGWFVSAVVISKSVIASAAWTHRTGSMNIVSVIESELLIYWYPLDGYTCPPARREVSVIPVW